MFGEASPFLLKLITESRASLPVTSAKSVFSNLPDAAPSNVRPADRAAGTLFRRRHLPAALRKRPLRRNFASLCPDRPFWLHAYFISGDYLLRPVRLSSRSTGPSGRWRAVACRPALLQRNLRCKGNGCSYGLGFLRGPAERAVSDRSGDSVEFARRADDAEFVPLHARVPAHIHDGAHVVHVFNQDGGGIFHGRLVHGIRKLRPYASRLSENVIQQV